ncbi:hypothetical protein [Tabrizicola sp. BL-A-41-H6]|uniref:hypothetical protein n=1 Tax=Tabrizicola sp. BL-A-41-H6 TaxID=3421107 RepID=UPI003D677B01
MMRIILSLLAILLATPALAQTAKVTSGEHADFTRLVVTLPDKAEWRFGRTEAGYELVAAALPALRYDLSGIWDRIPRSRLTNVWADPTTGALQLSLGCACHAFPFEFEPGTIVIDLRNGPAPPGSEFEAALDGSAVVALANGPDVVAEPSEASGFDWLQAARGPAEPIAAGALPTVPLATGRVSLGPLRDTLLMEISRGAAEGMVDVTPKGLVPPRAEAPPGDLPWSQVSIGELSGFAVGATVPATGEMQADGAACIGDASLDIAKWGGDGPEALRIAEARGGLLGEFDVPDPLAVKRAVRHHLFLGFGAEALQYLGLLDPSGPEDPEARIYQSIARAVDGMQDPESPLARMLACDSAAALWAALLHDRLPAGAKPNIPAILRGFFDLPPHLRQHLGPGLADRFIASGDIEAARSVRDATARVPDIPGQDVALLDAKVDLGQGRLDEADAKAEAALKAGGPAGLNASLALVEARFRKLEPVGPDLPVAVSSYLAEAEGTPDHPALRRALVLSFALAGQTGNAQAALAASPETEPDFWRVVGARATDADLLQVAILPVTSPHPAAEPEISVQIARRLVALGFADAALHWLGAQDQTAPPETRLLAAEAELMRGDARAARDLLSGIDTPAAEATRAKALFALGSIGPAADSARAGGDLVTGERLEIWNRNWPEVAQNGPSPWQEAAAITLAVTTEGTEAGLLAQGAASADRSQKVRDAVAGLLEDVAQPAASP